VTVAIPPMPEPLKDDIARLEEAIGGTLPLEYLEFVRTHNGATPESNSMPIGSDNESGVRCFVPVAEAVSIVSEIKDFPRGTIPLAEDGCGNYFYVGLRSGSVFFWDHEIADGDTKVASTLAEFVSALEPFDGSAVKLAPGQVIYAWVDPSFKPEFD
jgi:cell wall assembly regulator SMI1